MPNLTMYTKNNCPKCLSLKDFLASQNIEFKTINIDEDAQGLATVQQMGYMAAPVLLNNDSNKSCSGFNPAQAFQVVNG